MTIVDRFKAKRLIKKVLREWEKNGEILSGWKVTWNKEDSSFKIDIEPTEKMKDSSRMTVLDL